MGYDDKEKRYFAGLSFDHTYYQIWRNYNSGHEWTKIDNLFSDDAESTLQYVRLLRKKELARQRHGSDKYEFKIFVVHNSSEEIT